MNLIKTSFYTSLSTGITFLTGFVITKVVAVQIGPSGMAYYGQFVNITSLLSMLGTGAITSGIIKYLAQYAHEEERRQKIISTAFLMVIASSLVISVCTIACSRVLSGMSFKTPDFWIVYVVYGFALTAISLNLVFSSVLNGLKKIKSLTIINIISSLLSMVSMVVASHYFGLTGVLVSSSVVAVGIMCVNMIVFRKAGISWKISLHDFDKNIVRKLLAFSAMAIVSGAAAPAMQVLVRNKIINTISLQDAGYWQAVTRISDYYLGFVTAVLTVYYLPRLSELKTAPEIKKEIFYGYKIILPVAGILSLLVWWFRDVIIHLLFTPDFIEMKQLFAFQLIGDFLKIGSWLLAFIMVAKAMTRTFIVTEIIFATSFVILASLFVDHFGLIGATYAFALNYFLYWLTMIGMVRIYFRSHPA